ncbi:hypothetical protein [Bradyrhizobium sp.]|uniref:hypothetical protein n=1 Tax=Bradyrhizobium sp. TaxID=376 RepID=UPI0039E5A131
MTKSAYSNGGCERWNSERHGGGGIVRIIAHGFDEPNSDKIADAMIDDARTLIGVEPPKPWPRELGAPEPIDFDSWGECGKVVAFGLLGIAVLVLALFVLWDLAA